MKGRTGNQRRRAGGDHGATLVEFAFVVPILVAFVFGIIDFGNLYYQLQSMRQGTQSSARLINTGTFGTTTSCSLTPAPASSATQEAMCQTKKLTQLGDNANTRVAILLPNGYTKGQPVIVCVEYPESSVSGVYSSLLSGKTQKTEAYVRIEQVSATETLVAAQETSISGSWAWCT